jgi:hypothetical protein
MTVKISTSPLLAEHVRHSSYDSSALPEILPSCPVALIFHFFFFSTSLINKTIKE